MAIIAPFHGVRFNLNVVDNLEDVVTPPYDVISEEDGHTLLQKNPYNMIQLDLRNDSQAKEGQKTRYSDAHSLFGSWQEDQILVRDDKPAMYLYYIDYTHPSGKKMTRKGMVSLVGLAEFSEGIVRPHEKTFDAVIADRLELMETCRAQFSKVFSIYSDKENAIMALLEQNREPEALCSTKDHNGNTHTLWRVTDPAALSQVSQQFKDKSIYIADGHHRYTTALGCRKRALLKNPDMSADNPFNFIMMYLCCMEDEGLSILPTHRLILNPGPMSADELASCLDKRFEVEEISGGSREILIGEVLARMNEADMDADVFASGAYHAGEDRCFFLKAKPDALKDSVVASKPDVLQNLDVVIFSELLIHESLQLDHKRCLREKLVRYFSDPDAALDLSVKMSIADDNHTPLLFLINPTKVHQVMNVADKGEVMPHKSTYFYPKIMTGLLINKLVEDEKIELL